MNLTIRHIEHNITDGRILTIHWKATEGIESLEGSTHLAEPPTPMLPYVEVTEAIATEWLTNNLDIEGITSKLQKAKPPLNGSGLPWVVTKNAYLSAIARLAKYVLADGQVESITMVDTLEVAIDDDGMQILDDDGNVTFVKEAVTIPFIEALEPTVEVTEYPDEPDGEPVTSTVENPEITQDNAQRAEAQAVVDSTPQPVIDKAVEEVA
jgi:hypothetical protein